MAHYEVVQRLEAEPSKTAKEEIVLQAFNDREDEFFLGAQLAYDVTVTFGVASNIPGISADDLNPDDPGTFTFGDFITLTTRLRNREITGNAAKEAISKAASSCHGPSWNDFYRRILQKDFRCGATEGTINRVLSKLAKKDARAKQLMVPVFSCQLAEDGEKEVHKKKVCGKKLLDSKLDGIRLLTVLDKASGTVLQYTRNGLPSDRFPQICEALLPLLEALPGSVVLDGEITGKTFQELMSQFGDVNKSSKTTRLALFDIIPLDDFRNGRCETPQIERHAILSEMELSGMFQNLTGGSVYVIPKILVDLDTEEGRAQMNAFNKTALAAGLEGIMCKSPDAPYECRRNTSWLKIKPVISVDLEVIGVELGKEDGKYSNVMGALVCRGIDDGKDILVKVGSGFSDEDRVKLWETREDVIGSLVEIEADVITQASDSETYSLRFPRFVRFRELVKGQGKI